MPAIPFFKSEDGRRDRPDGVVVFDEDDCGVVLVAVGVARPLCDDVDEEGE